MKTIVQKVRFKATPKELYDIILDPQKHSAATGAKATGNGKLGGAFTAWDGYIKGKILALVPGRMIAQSWRSGEFRPKDHDSVLVLTFEKEPGGTLMTMTHTAVPDHKADDFAKGWRTHYWQLIQKYLKKK
jgi:activator of HSP90 ATPase